MAKSKSVYICSECGQEYPKWSGRCNACGAWNTLEETLIQPKSHGLAKSTGGGRLPLSSINNLSFSDETRYKTGMSELDRVRAVHIRRGKRASDKAPCRQAGRCKRRALYQCLYRLRYYNRGRA